MIGLSKIARGLWREHRKVATRSPHWPVIRRQHIARHPTCAACGGTTLLQVHHVLPFHTEPALELDPGNLITLCIVNGCHNDIGHGDDYEFYNPRVRDHAALLHRGVSRYLVSVAARRDRLPNRPI